MILAAADPGKSGAVVTIDCVAKTGYYYPLEYDKTGLLHGPPIVALLAHTKPKRIFLEKVQGRGHWNATANFNFGICAGQLRYVLAHSGLPYQFMTAQAWQKTAHEGIDTKLSAKAKSYQAYKNLFPHGPIPGGPRGGQPHDGVIDALLMLVFGFEKFNVIPDDWQLEKWNGGVGL